MIKCLIISQDIHPSRRHPFLPLEKNSPHHPTPFPWSATLLFPYTECQSLVTSRAQLLPSAMRRVPTLSRAGTVTLTLDALGESIFHSWQTDTHSGPTFHHKQTECHCFITSNGESPSPSPSGPKMKTERHTHATATPFRRDATKCHTNDMNPIQCQPPTTYTQRECLPPQTSLGLNFLLTNSARFPKQTPLFHSSQASEQYPTNAV